LTSLQSKDALSSSESIANAQISPNSFVFLVVVIGFMRYFAGDYPPVENVKAGTNAYS